MYVMVCGSRSIKEKKWVFQCIEKYLKQIEIDDFVLIEGGANGVDLLAREWAVVRGIKIEEATPEWNKYGYAAGIIRNKKMVEKADYVLILWDGTSRGTKSDIDYAIKMNKNHKIFLYPNVEPLSESISEPKT